MIFRVNLKDKENFNIQTANESKQSKKAIQNINSTRNSTESNDSTVDFNFNNFQSRKCKKNFLKN